MSGGSSSAAGWCSRLEPVAPPATYQRADDPRLETVVEFWRGDPAALQPGRAVIVGFPQDEGVRRNQGRPGAALAPGAIRHWLYRLAPWDATDGADLSRVGLLDVGDGGSLASDPVAIITSFRARTLLSARTSPVRLKTTAESATLRRV